MPATSMVCLAMGDPSESLGMYDKQVESSWMKSKGQANVGHTTVNIYYRLPDQKEVDETHGQLKTVSQSQTRENHA